MSVTHPSGSDLESMNEFYDKKFLRAVTLLAALVVGVTESSKGPPAPRINETHQNMVLRSRSKNKNDKRIVDVSISMCHIITITKLMSRIEYTCQVTTMYDMHA